MPQLTIYLDSETAKIVKKAAKAAKVSQSQWVADAIRSRARTEWPDAVLKSFGTWNDFPTIEEIRAGHGTDVPRETL